MSSSGNPKLSKLVLERPDEARKRLRAIYLSANCELRAACDLAMVAKDTWIRWCLILGLHEEMRGHGRGRYPRPPRAPQLVPTGYTLKTFNGVLVAVPGRRCGPSARPFLVKRGPEWVAPRGVSLCRGGR